MHTYFDLLNKKKNSINIISIMKFSVSDVKKIVAVATIISLVAVSYIMSVSEDAYSSSMSRNLSEEVSLARLRRNDELNNLNLRGKLQQTSGNVNVNQLDAAENDPSPSATHHETKVSYVTSFWAKGKGEEVNPHRREVEAALLANIHNPHFDQVVVFLDRDDNAESCVDFHQAMSDLNRQVFSMTPEESNELLAIKVKCVDVQTGQPTYYQMFSNAVSDVVTGDVVVLANADMAFDDTMSLARSLNPEVLAVLSTSGFSNKMAANVKKIYDEMMGTDYMAKDVEQSGTWEIDRCAESNRSFSWDTWIFHKSKLMGRLNEENFKRRIQTHELVAFHMNENGAENAALWAVEQSYQFSSVYSACDKIQSWHFHLTPKTHKVRETPWFYAIKDRQSPMFTPPGSVPKPWGGYQVRRHAYARKDPDCVRTDSCFSLI